MSRPISDHQEANLVARAITDRLKGYNVTVFGESIDGETTPADVMGEHARHSLVLIQVIQVGSFQDQPHNWMFEEYEAFVSNRELGDPRKQNRYLPIILDDAIEARSFMPREYQGWFDHIRSLDAMKLTSCSVQDVVSPLSEVVKAIDERRRVMLDP